VGSGFFLDHHPHVAHNSFVQCFAETGLVGYFLWLGLIAVSLSQLTTLADSATDPAWSRWARAVRLSLLAFLFAALFLSRTTSPMLFFLLSLPAALCGMAERNGERVPVPRNWWTRTLGFEAVSIILVWITARAFHG
jgi:O-antigen ligase